MNENEKPGATGKYPQGKLNEHDEGELVVAVKADALNQRIILDFGKPVAWVAMTADQAEGFAELLKKHAAAIRNVKVFRKNLG